MSVALVAVRTGQIDARLVSIRGFGKPRLVQGRLEIFVLARWLRITIRYEKPLSSTALVVLTLEQF